VSWPEQQPIVGLLTLTITV